MLTRNTYLVSKIVHIYILRVDSTSFGQHSNDFITEKLMQIIINFIIINGLTFIRKIENDR